MTVAHRNPLLVIADDAHVRFVRPDSDDVLHSLYAIDALAALAPPPQPGCDRMALSHRSVGSALPAPPLRPDPLAQARHRFAHAVGELINAECVDTGFDALVLAAPADILAAIRDHLDSSVALRIVGTVAQNLVNTPDSELWPHVRPWFAAARNRV